MKRPRIFVLLALSLVANFLGLAIAGTLIYKRGGIAYLREKVESRITPPVARPAFELARPGSPWERSIFRSPIYQFSHQVHQAQQHTPADVVILGGTPIFRGDWNGFLRHPDVRNRGIEFDTTPTLLTRLPTVLQGTPRKIILMIGINDLFMKREIPKILEYYTVILDQIAEESSNTEVEIFPVMPIHKGLFQHASPGWLTDNKKTQELNSLLGELITNRARKEERFHAASYDYFTDADGNFATDYTYDGIHPSAQWYAEMSEFIRPLL